jgi:hypothetical protein
MITPILPFKQQQNIAQSHFSPFITVLEKKKRDCLKLLLRSSLRMKSRKIGEI